MAITGRVLRADGTPAALAPVVLEREPTFGVTADFKVQTENLSCPTSRPGSPG